MDSRYISSELLRKVPSAAVCGQVGNDKSVIIDSSKSWIYYFFIVIVGLDPTIQEISDTLRDSDKTFYVIKIGYFFNTLRKGIPDNAKPMHDHCRHPDGVSLNNVLVDYFLEAVFLSAFRWSSALVCFRRCWRSAFLLPLFISINLLQFH